MFGGSMNVFFLLVSIFVWCVLRGSMAVLRCVE